MRTADASGKKICCNSYKIFFLKALYFLNTPRNHICSLNAL